MLSQSRITGMLAWSALLAGLSVALGAVGSHLLSKLLAADKLEIFNKGTQYLMTHSLAVILFLLLKSTTKVFINTYGVYMLFSGGILFSFSLFLVSLSGLPAGGWLRAFGMTAPAGGLLMIAGWVLISTGLFSSLRKI